MDMIGWIFFIIFDLSLMFFVYKLYTMAKQ